MSKITVPLSATGTELVCEDPDVRILSKTVGVYYIKLTLDAYWTDGEENILLVMKKKNENLSTVLEYSVGEVRSGADKEIPTALLETEGKISVWVGKTPSSGEQMLSGVLELTVEPSGGIIEEGDICVKTPLSENAVEKVRQVNGVFQYNASHEWKALAGQNKVDEELAKKVDKVEGKGLSTNDYTDEDKDKLDTLLYAADINSQAIANVNARKVDKVEGKGLSTNDFTTELKDKLDGMEEGANKTTVDAELSATSENPVQNKIVKAALDKKITEPTSNGLVRKWMSGLYTTVGVDTTMPTSPTDNSVPSTKLLGDKLKNALGMSDANLQKSGLLIQTYTPAGSTPGTVGTRTYSVIERDVSTLDDTNTGRGKVPSSYVVGEYVKESISTEQSRSDNTFSNALKGSKSGGAFLIDDVSPVTREMGVKVSSDTIEDLTAVKVRKQGKNLIPFPYRDLTLGTSTYNGIDFTVYEDGSILINGTATKSTTKYLYNNATDLLGLKSGITISGSKNASDDTQQGNVYFLCNYYNSTGTMTQGVVASTTPSGTKTITDEWKGLGIYINIPNGKTLSNLLIKPQLEIGATATEYEPYITPTEYIPTADGTVNGVTSLYPNTTLTTDTEGVIINCNYNRDINKAFAALEAAIATNNS